MALTTHQARSYEKRSINIQLSEQIAKQQSNQRSKPSNSVAVCRLTEA